MKNFPKVKIYAPEQIRAIRETLRDSRPQFARRFLVSDETVKGWETGRRNQQGPALVIMQQLEALIESYRARERATLAGARNRHS